MITVKLRDKLVAHDKEFFKDSTYIKFNRDPVNNGDIVIYTIHNFNEYYSNANKNIALFLESPKIENRFYNYILHNIDSFPT